MKTLPLLPALLLAVTAAAADVAAPDSGFIVHEWGTFTSVQGADGVQMEWTPQLAPDLPAFVYRQPFSGGLTKGSMVARQRMETPVLYFYSDKARTVDVAVRFPQGAVTEWYPQKSALNANAASGLLTTNPGVFLPRIDISGKDQPPKAGSPSDKTGSRFTTPPALHWSRIDLLGKGDAAKASLPADATSSHYYAARETDSSLLRVWDSDQKNELEKFLFYRGVASFTTPLQVRQGSSDPRQVTLLNSGGEELRHLFLYEVGPDGRLSWQSVDRLAPSQDSVLDLSGAHASGSASLAAALRTALADQGLYEKEAAAMVHTWESSWFAERGLRVLYILPRAWTDRVLPLSVTPAPRDVQRVMVARAEIITPAMEAALLEKIQHYMAATPEVRPAIVAETRALGMGRFTESVLRRLNNGPGPGRGEKFFSASWQLVSAATQPATKTPTPVSK